VDRGDLGELPLFLAVNSALGADDAMVAAVSWEAGRYVAWKSGDRMCVRARFLLDAPWTTELTAKVLEAWAAKQVDASVEAPGTVVLTSCR